jgi:phosphatidylserine/phosphatidylglycerophosphate/cardiolipin synthase-like enzyme
MGRSRAVQGRRPLPGRLSRRRTNVLRSPGQRPRPADGGAGQKQILAQWDNDAFGNSIAIGTSSVHNAISHLKIVIVDGVFTVKGSTNWSLSGEQRQDNELTLSRNAVIAAETRAILDLNHDFMLKQMVGTKLDVKTLLAPKTATAMPPLPPAPAN